MSRFKFEMDYKSGIIDAREEGMEEGIQVGRQEGRREGIQVGRQEGIQAGRAEIAKTLKELGDSVERIARVTGLSPDEIAGL
jgi:predicted transposase/invertase (TIGR01784 family)